MNLTLIISSMILAWIAFLVALYLHFFVITKWFLNPPASFELIRRQSNWVKIFWMTTAALYLLITGLALYLNWQLPDVRDYLAASIACFGFTLVFTSMYFAREINAFSKIPATAPATDDLMKRVKFWTKWNVLRDILLGLSAIFATIAFSFFHS